MPIESTIDHTGPMTANVADNALLLEVLAGPDGFDPRQYAPKVTSYTELLREGVEGHEDRHPQGRLRRVEHAGGRCREGQGGCRAIRQAWRQRLGGFDTGASARAHAAWNPITLEGFLVQMMIGNGMGFNWKGLYDVGLLDAHSSWRNRADDLSETLKLTMLVGQWARSAIIAVATMPSRATSRSQPRPAYDAVFGSYDLLLMPTLPCVATPIPAKDAPPRRDRPACLRDDGYDQSLRCYRPSGDEHSLRPFGRPACRADADCEGLRRGNHLSGGQRV